MTDFVHRSFLDILLERSPLPYNDVIVILVNALNSLKECHIKGQVNGAVLPENLLLYPDDNFRVEFRGDISSIILPEDLTNFDLKKVIGLSPEHFHNKQSVDHRSDLYGLGYITYYLLTGQANPYGAETAVALAEKVRLSSLPDPALIKQGIPEWLSRMVQKLTAPEPSQRYQSVFSVIRNIDKGLASETKPVEVSVAPEISDVPPTTPSTVGGAISADSTIKQMEPLLGALSSIGKQVYEKKKTEIKRILILKAAATILTVLVVVIALVTILNHGKKSDKVIGLDNHRIVKGQVENNFVLVEGGEFMMGSADSKEDDERPVHKVRVSSFYMAKAELTQEEWSTLMGNNPSDVKGSNLPVSQVSWFQAIDYCNKRSQSEGFDACYSINGNTNPASWSSGEVECNWHAAGYRLPTEAEWEFAAKGGNKSHNYIYPGSNDPNQVSWTKSNSNLILHPVRQLSPNELGLFDMGANIEEWCWDWYNPDYYQISTQDNPTGSNPTKDRVLRGGSWKYAAQFSIASNRAYDFPWKGSLTNGFRLARSSN